MEADHDPPLSAIGAGMPRLLRLRLKNYRSVAECDLRLGPLTYLVGANGSGKSNLMDALRFTAEALSHTLAHALQLRGGLEAIRRKSVGHPHDFTVGFELVGGDGTPMSYSFTVGAVEGGATVTEESGTIAGHAFRRRGSEVTGSLRQFPRVVPDRLLLVALSGDEAFRPLYDLLVSMQVHNPVPDKVRELEDPAPHSALFSDGGNICSVVERLFSDLSARNLVTDYLGMVAPGVVRLDVARLGNRLTLMFTQANEGAESATYFDAQAMSDGTLRALAILVAILQPPPAPTTHFLCLGIEEPEMALHPAATAYIQEALRLASRRRQLVISTHSPDLLNDREITDEMLRVVTLRGGRTEVWPIDEYSRQALRDRLCTPGFLLRTNALQPLADPVDPAVESLHE